MNPSRIGRYSVVGRLSKSVDEDVLVGEMGGRRVAIRLFDVADREELSAEARRIAGLSHANIAHQEVGLHEERPFLAAELAGTPLETWLGGDHGLAEQLLVIEGIAAGLAHAHAQGVVHGRLSPPRIVVDADGAARIWGFGLRGTQPDHGVSAYLAPEVLDGGEAGAQADVYSAGVVFYEILAGAPPTGDVPRPLQEVRKDVPKDLADAIMACRERAADWRPKDLEYLLEVLGRTRTGLPKPKPAPQPSFETPRMLTPAPRRRAAPPFLPIAIGVVLVGAGALYFLTRGGGAAPPPEAAATPPAATLPATPAPAVDASPDATPGATTTPEAGAVLATPGPTPSPTPAAAATPRPTPPPGAATPSPSLATPPPTSTLPAPPSTLAAAEASPPPTSAPAPAAGPALLRAISPPSLRRGQRTLVDVRGQNLYAGQGAALLRNGRPAEAARVLQQRFVNPTLVQVFIEVDAQATPGPYSLLLSDGQNVTNAVRFDVAK